MRKRFNLANFLEKLSHSLDAEFNAARQSTATGETVEKDFRAFLRKHLPQRFGVGTGHVVDFKNETSRQSDVVLYDRLYCPRLMGGDEETPDCYPVDGVLGVIQVTDKKLGKQKLQDDMDKIQSVRGLDLSLPMPPHFQDGRPFGMIFATRAIEDLERLRLHVDTRRSALINLGQPYHCINAVVVLDRGIICYRHPLLNHLSVDPAVEEDTPRGKQRWTTAVFEFGSTTVARFLMLLLNRLVIQTEALCLARANAVRRGRGQTLDLSYAAAVDAQVTTPNLQPYFLHAVFQKLQRDGVSSILDHFGQAQEKRASKRRARKSP